MFPSLKGNALWERAWKTHGALSVCPFSVRPKVEAAAAELLENSCDIVRKQFRVNQFTVDSSTRHADASSSACVCIASRLGTDYMAGTLSAADLLDETRVRAITLEGVKECDSFRKVNGQYVMQSCMSRQVDDLMVEMEFCFSKEQLCRSISCQRSKHAICITAQIPSTSRLFVSVTGDTVTILIDVEVLTFHDSHTGRTVQIQGRGIRAAEALVDELYTLFTELGCATDQLEMVHCYFACGEPARAETIEALKSHVDDHGHFLDRFCALAPVIAGRWMEKLHNMGDVEGCDLSYGRLRARSYQVRWMPHWFLPSLFFIMHQWRFTKCMSAFVGCCLDLPELWEEDGEETGLEKKLQNAMPDITATVTAVWAIITDAASPSVDYIQERDVMPSDLLQFVGGYAHGPRSWEWERFPLT